MNKYEVNSLAVYGDYDCFHCTVVNVFPVELEKPVIKIYCPDCEKVVYAPKLKTGQAVFHCPHCRSPLPIDSTGEFGPRYHYIIEAIRGYSLNNKSIFLHFFARTPHISFSKGDYLFVTGTLCYIEEGNKIQDVLLLGSFEKKSNRLNELIVFEEITSENDEGSGVDRNSQEYKDWRNGVIFRDRKCVCCGLDKHLEAHHLFGFKDNKSLRVDVNNGVTLCSFCHNKYHSVYGYDDVNPVDFVKFMSRYGV